MDLTPLPKRKAKTSVAKLMLFWLTLASSLSAAVFLAGFNQAQGATSEEIKQDLRNRLDQIQTEIEEYRKNIQQAQVKENDVQTQVSLLKSKIRRAELELESLALAITDTQNEINARELTLQRLEESMAREKELLSVFLRMVDQGSNANMIELLFGGQSLSDIFSKIAAFEDIQSGLQASLDEIIRVKAQAIEEKNRLEDKQEELYELRALQDIQARTLRNRRAEQENLLGQIKNKKEQLLGVVSDRQKDLQAIREQLYLLEGIGVALKFEEALHWADLAFQRTGVRPAFLLALLKRESEWGTNVGRGNWRSDMHPRDHQAFLQITAELGLDPDNVPVSRKPSYGWGGAMGSAQFLPTTWLAYKDRVAQLTGHYPPSPWNIEDAFTAAAVKLAAAGGAAPNNPKAEWKAAQIYFAGRRWNNPRYYFYGDSIIELASVFQAQIDLLRSG